MTTIPYGPWVLTINDDQTTGWLEWREPMHELTKPIDAFDRVAIALSETPVTLK